MLMVMSCANTDKETYQIEATLINSAIDTFSVEVRYNKDLRNIELNVINSNLFNEDGIEMAYGLASTHPLGIFYKDTLNKLNPSLVQFSKIAKDYENPLGAKLIDNSIVFNRDLVLQKHVGSIQSFKVLSLINTKLYNDVGVLDKKLLEFINNPDVTAAQLDAIPYVSLKAATNIINARPIKNAYQLNQIPYVSDEAVRRLRIKAETIQP